MPRIRKKKKSQNNTRLRLLAWTLALVVALASWAASGTRLCLLLEAVAATLFAVGAVWPHAFRSLYFPLRRLARRAWFF
jgi:hypothetical protein